MNAGFRNLLGKRDTTKFKAFLLAIAVQMVVLPFLERAGLIHLTVPPLYPVGVILGGFIFGIAMNWGGGCAAGIWYKAGAGNIGALISLFTLTVGYVITENGALKHARLTMQ